MSNNVLPFTGPKFNRPETKPEVSKGLLVANNSEVLARELARCEFEANNTGVYVNQKIITVENRRYKRLNLDLTITQVKRLFESEEKVVITADIIKKLPPFSWVKAGTLLTLGLGGVIIGNQVGAAYILNSGFDLYANDPWGAAKFMAVAFLGSGALKGYECFIASNLGKKLYNLAIFGLGLPALITWMDVFATVFVPDTTSGMAGMTGANRYGAEVVSRLLFLHLLIDTFLGYICFAAAEKVLLDGNEPESVSNPARDKLDDRVKAIEAELHVSGKVLSLSRDWLDARANSARAHEIAIVQEIGRAKTRAHQIAMAATSAAQAEALK